VRGLVEAVQLAPARVRPRGQHLHPCGRRPQRGAQPEDQTLGGGLGVSAVAALEGAGQRGDQGLEPRGLRQGDRDEAVALEIDRLLPPRETVEVGEEPSPSDATAEGGGGN
jgi:hypothetical protein